MNEAERLAWHGVPELSGRARLTELMDGPCTYKEFRDCLRDLAKVNRMTRAHKLTMQWLAAVVREYTEPRPLHIVDIGCGGGDLLRSVEQWAAREQVTVRLTGIDVHPYAIRAAREFTDATSSIRWQVSDAHDFAANEPVDFVVSSQMAHHMRDEEIVQFLKWMERTAARGWLVNDLYRTRAAFVGFRMLAWAARWHRFVRNDGPVSIRRGFRSQDWQQYVELAGLAADSVRIEAHWPARICVGRVRLS